MIVVAMAIVAIAVFGVLYFRSRTTKRTNEGPKITDQDELTGRNKDKADSGSSTDQKSLDSAQTALAKPTLSMSSGNNGPVSVGAVVEFVCQDTTPDVSCDIVLVKQPNGQTTRLGTKKLTSNNYNQTGATWTWAAVKGSWKVMSQATSGNQSQNSAEKTLEVQ